MVDTLNDIFISAWNKRLSVYEWATSLDTIVIDDSIEHILCDYFITFIQQGNMTNKLLYDYIEYSIAQNIISFEYFITKLLNSVQDQNITILTSSKFPMILKIIENFLPSFRFDNSIDINDNNHFNIIINCFLLLIEGVKYAIEILSNDDNYSSSEPNLTNINNSLKFIILILKKERFRGYFSLVKQLHPKLWNEFYTKSSELHSIFCSNEKIRVLRSIWVQYCHSLSLILQPSIHIFQNIFKISPVNLIQNNNQSIASDSPWNSLSFAIRYLIFTNDLNHSDSTKTENMLKEFKTIHQWNTCDFYAYLIIAIFKIEYSILKLPLPNKNTKDMERSQCCNYFLQILPILFTKWENETNPSYFYEKKHDLTSVELALSHICYFPGLFRRSQNNSGYELLHDFLYSCESRGLISIKNISNTLEINEIPIPIMLEHEEFNFESIKEKQLLANTPEDIIMLEQFIKDEDNPLSSNFDILITCLVHSITNNKGRQELITKLICDLVNQDSDINSIDFYKACIILKKIAVCEGILYAFSLHNQMIDLITGIVMICEELGQYITIQSQPTHDIFSTIIFLLLRIILKYQIKEKTKNQNIFVNIVKHYPFILEWYSRFLQSFLINDIPSMFSGVQVQQISLYLQTTNNQSADEFIKSIIPWQILICFPIRIQREPFEQIKAIFHQKIVELCKAFYPLAISVNEIYNPILTQLSMSSTNFSLINELLQNNVPAEVFTIFSGMKLDAQKEYERGINVNTNDVNFVTEIRGSPCYSDFLVNVSIETNKLFTTLLNGNLALSQNLLTSFHLLLNRMGKREFISTILKEVIVLTPKSSISHGSVYAVSAAKLGGSIIGLCGPEVVSELLTHTIPLFVPVISSEKQAQLIAHVAWSACNISQIFAITSEDIKNGYYSNLIETSRYYFLLFLTELLERQCRAPSHVLSLPITFFHF